MKNVKKWVNAWMRKTMMKITDSKKDMFIDNMWKVRHFINDTYYNCRYAIQRAYRGYDDVDIFNLNDELAEYLISVLTTFRKTKHCLIVKMNADGTAMHKEDYDKTEFSPTDPTIYMTEKEEEDFFDKWIGAIRLMDTDYVSHILDIKYGSISYSNWEKMQERNNLIQHIQNNAKKYVFDTLCLYYNQLWD